MHSTVSKTEAPEVPPQRCFESTAHPGDRAAAHVYARAMVRPLAAVMVPLMVAALAAVLLEQRIWPHVGYGAAAAMAVAGGWVRFQLRRTPAEVRVRTAAALPVALRSVSDVLREAPPVWQRLWRLRADEETLRLDLGDTSHRLLRRRWPGNDALLEALREACERT